MNKTLIRAAAVINIVAASLIFLACSGDDGKDGKDSCLVQRNASTGLFDITCGGAYVTSISEGGQGPAGASCTATPFATGNGGVYIQCGSGEQYPIYNGAGGASGTGCEVTSATVPTTGDPAINIRCPDQRAATILVCPGGTKATGGSTGLLVNTDGMVGKCQADGTISRSGDIAVLVCGTYMFDPTKEFCQNTIEDNGSVGNDTAGLFAVFSSIAGVERVTVGDYPSASSVYSATHPYNRASGKPGVKSVALPLCGVEPALASASQAVVGQLHKSGSGRGGTLTSEDNQKVASWAGDAPSVYNDNQICARNLVYKIGSGSGTISGKPAAGGLNDINAKSPASKAWQVINKGQCLADIAIGESPINGFKWVSNGSNITNFRLTRPCTFAGAEIIETAGNPPFTTCPDAKSVYSVDDMRCVNRIDDSNGAGECIYHSTIDNTCLASTDKATLKNSLIANGDSAFITHKKGTGENATYIVNVGSFNFSTLDVDTASPENARRGTDGVMATKLGSRLGAVKGTTGVLSSGGNIWSKACVTQSRTAYYAVNDPYLSNKAFKFAANGVASNPADFIQLTAVASAAGISPSGFIYVQPPICEDTTPVAGNPGGIAQQKVAFEDAFACLNGTMSMDLDYHDGSSWDKPLYCVLDGKYTSNKYCVVTGTGITQSVCNTKLTEAATANAPNTALTTVSFSYSESVCKVSGSYFTGTDDQAACRALGSVKIKVDVPESVAGTIRGVSVIASSGDPAGTFEGCIVYNEDLQDGSTQITSPSCSDATSSIDKLWYGNNNPVLGNITAAWQAAGTTTKPVSVQVTNASGVTSSVSLTSYCTVSSSHSTALNAENCAQITAAARTKIVPTTVDDASFYWVQ